MAYICRTLALIVLLLAFVSLRLADKTPHVLVVALDGLDAATVDRLSADGVLPNISGVLSRGRRVDIFGGSRRDPRGFWRTVLAAGEPTPTAQPRVWDVVAAHEARAVIVGVPETGEVIRANQLVLPGANETSGFIGGNIGRVLEPSSDVEAAGWPYADIAPEAALEIRALAAGAVSEWISTTVPGRGERKGMFRAYRLPDGALYLSPIYRTVRPARTYAANAPSTLFYVADDPGWTAASARLKDYFYAHATDVVRSRAELAALLAAEHPTMLVYFDGSVALLGAAYSRDGGERREEVVVEAYRALDGRIATLMSRLPRAASVILLARLARDDTADKGGRGGPTGFLVCPESLDKGSGRQRLDASRVGFLLLDLVGVPPAGRTAPALEREMSPPGFPLTPHVLSNLGLLPASSAGPAPDATGGAAAVTAAPGE